MNIDTTCMSTMRHGTQDLNRCWNVKLSWMPKSLFILTWICKHEGDLGARNLRACLRVIQSQTVNKAVDERCFVSKHHCTFSSLLQVPKLPSLETLLRFVTMSWISIGLNYTLASPCLLGKLVSGPLCCYKYSVGETRGEKNRIFLNRRVPFKYTSRDWVYEIR